MITTYEQRLLERICRYIARLAALAPRPRVNLTRYHGVFAPNRKLRSQVTLSATHVGRRSRRLIRLDAG